MRQFEEGKYYDGIVTAAGLSVAGDKGLVWMKIKTEHGLVEYEKFVTPNTLEYIEEMMVKCFGITAEDMARKDFFAKEFQERALGATVNGKIQYKADGREGYPPKAEMPFPGAAGGGHRKKASPEIATQVANLFSARTGKSTGGSGWD